MIQVKHGTETGNVNNGATVKDAAQQVGVRVGIFSKPTVFVNGRPETDFERVLREGDVVEFPRAGGGKG